MDLCRMGKRQRNPSSRNLMAREYKAVCDTRFLLANRGMKVYDRTGRKRKEENRQCERSSYVYRLRCY